MAPSSSVRVDAAVSPVVSEYRLKRRVLFHETDMAGVVHFSCFFKYMEEAEHAMWRSAGLSIAPAGAQVGWPRVSASCDFKRPLRFEDEFEVWLRITKVSARSIGYVAALLRDGETIASGAMTVACVRQGADGVMVPAPIPTEVASRLRVTEATV